MAKAVSAALPHQTADDCRNCFTPKKPFPTDGMSPYYQVFADRMPFTPNLSVVDLLMNIGPEAKNYLETIEI